MGESRPYGASHQLGPQSWHRMASYCGFAATRHTVSSVLQPGGCVKLFVTRKKGQFAVKGSPPRRLRSSKTNKKRRSKAKSRPNHAQPAAPPPRNYIYMQHWIFRKHRGIIENEFAVLKIWRRFSNKMKLGNLHLLNDELVSFCENLLKEFALGTLK